MPGPGSGISEAERKRFEAQNYPYSDLQQKTVEELLESPETPEELRDALAILLSGAPTVVISRSMTLAEVRELFNREEG